MALENTRCPGCGARALCPERDEKGILHAVCFLCSRWFLTNVGRREAEARAIEEALAAAAVRGFNYLRDSHIVMLCAVARRSRGLSLPGLCRRTRFNEQQALRGLQYLEAKGLIELREDVYALTDTGRFAVA